MENKTKDKTLEEIDSELRDIDKKLKKVFSRTDSVLKEWKDETQEGEAEEDPQVAHVAGIRGLDPQHKVNVLPKSPGLANLDAGGDEKENDPEREDRRRAHKGNQ